MRMVALLAQLRPTATTRRTAASATAAAASSATPSAPTVPRLLVIHGKGCEERGKTPALIKSHGSLTMEDYTAQITEWAAGNRVEVQVYHSTQATAVAAELRAALAAGVTGVSFNPGAWTGGGDDAAEIFDAIDALTEAGVPVIETHISNPTVSRPSLVSPHCRGTVYGFGVTSYLLALEGLRSSAWVHR